MYGICVVAVCNDPRTKETRSTVTDHSQEPARLAVMVSIEMVVRGSKSGDNQTSSNSIAQKERRTKKKHNRQGSPENSKLVL